MPGQVERPGLFRRVLDNPTYHENRLLSAPVNVGMNVAGRVMKNTVYLAGLAGSASNDPLARGIGNYLRDSIVSKELDRVTQQTTKEILAHADDPEFMTRIMAGEGVPRPQVPIPGLRQQAARQAMTDLSHAYQIKGAPTQLKLQEQAVELNKLRLENYADEQENEKTRIKLAERQLQLSEDSFKQRQNEFNFSQLVEAYKTSPTWQAAQVDRASGEYQRLQKEIALLEQSIKKGTMISGHDDAGKPFIIRQDESDPTGLTWRLADVPQIPGFVSPRDPNVDVVRIQDPKTGAESLALANAKTLEVRPFTWTGSGDSVITKGPDRNVDGKIAAARAIAADIMLGAYGPELIEELNRIHDSIINKPESSRTEKESDALRRVGVTMRMIRGDSFDADGSPIPPHPGVILSALQMYKGQKRYEEAHEVYLKTIMYAQEGYLYDVRTDKAYAFQQGQRVTYGAPEVSDPELSGGQKSVKDPFGRLGELFGGGGRGQEQPGGAGPRPMPQPGKLFERSAESLETEIGEYLGTISQLEASGETKLSEADADALYKKIQDYIRAGIKGPQLDALIRKLRAMDPQQQSPKEE